MNFKRGGKQPLRTNSDFRNPHDRPERIVHTEFFGEGESLVTSSITAKGNTTTLTMTMRFPGSP